MTVYFRQNYDSLPLSSAGWTQEELQNNYWTPMLGILNPNFVTTVEDPERTGRCHRQYVPKGKFYPADSSTQFHGDLSAIGANVPELYLAMWVRFPILRDRSVQMVYSMNAGSTADFLVENAVNINGFPPNNLLGDGVTQREHAGELIVGDPDGVYEVIEYQGWTGTGPTYTFKGPLKRGFRYTTPKAWPDGTPVYLGFDWTMGNKIPGFFGGTRWSGTAGTDFCSVRMYQSKSFSSSLPEKGGRPLFYGWDGVNPPKQFSYALGVAGMPAGYTGGEKLYEFDKWHPIEMRVKLNPVKGTANGEADMWFHGEHCLEVRNRLFRAADANFNTFNWLAFNSHWGGSNSSFKTLVEQHWYIDDLTIADTPINIHLNPPPPRQQFTDRSKRGIGRGIARGVM